MKIPARKIETLIAKSGGFQTLMVEIDDFIMQILPSIPREIFITSTMTAIGYGLMPYEADKHLSMWPVLSIAPQKNSVNLYVMAMIDNKYLPEIYGKSLGKVSLGKSCIRIKKMEDVNLKVLKLLLKDAYKYYLTKLR